MKIDTNALKVRAFRSIVENARLMDALDTIERMLPPEEPRPAQIVSPAQPKRIGAKPPVRRGHIMAQAEAAVVGAGGKPVSSGDVSRIVGIPRESIRSALESLVQQGRLRRRERMDKSKRWGKEVFYVAPKTIAV